MEIIYEMVCPFNMCYEYVETIGLIEGCHQILELKLVHLTLINFE